MAADDNVTMAQRDASWFATPNVRSVKVYHVVAFPMVAACNTSRMPLMAETEQPVAAIGVGMRCERPGCKSRWKGR